MRPSRVRTGTPVSISRLRHGAIRAILIRMASYYKEKGMSKVGVPLTREENLKLKAVAAEAGMHGAQWIRDLVLKALKIRTKAA